MARVQMLPALILLLDQRPLQLTEVGHCAKQDFFYPFTRFYLRGTFVKNKKHRVKTKQIVTELLIKINLFLEGD